MTKQETINKILRSYHELDGHMGYQALTDFENELKSKMRISIIRMSSSYPKDDPVNPNIMRLTPSPEDYIAIINNTTIE